MQEQAAKLRKAIARYERLLREGVNAHLARVYHAEIEAAKAMLEESEKDCATARRSD